MHQLLLLRHAKAAPDDPAQLDHARPLSARGRQEAATQRAAMQTHGLAPDVVLVSSALRTMQTLAALEPWEETPLVEPLDQLYLADAERMLGILRQVAETARRVLVIGHNPGLHDLAILLAGEQAILGLDPASRVLAEGFSTGTLAEFTVPGAWRDLDAGRARLVRMLRPKDLLPSP